MRDADPGNKLVPTPNNSNTDDKSRFELASAIEQPIFAMIDSMRPLGSLLKISRRSKTNTLAVLSCVCRMVVNYLPVTVSHHRIFLKLSGRDELSGSFLESTFVTLQLPWQVYGMQEEGGVLDVVCSAKHHRSKVDRLYCRL